MQQAGAAQVRGTVGFSFFIDQQGETDAGLLAEGTRVRQVAQSDGRNAGTPAMDFCFVFAQLRDVLTAEDSPVVAKEGHHGTALAPQRTQLNAISFRVRQRDLRQPRAQ